MSSKKRSPALRYGWPAVRHMQMEQVQRFSLRQRKSTSSARDLYETFNRAKRQYVKWSKVAFINDTTKYVLNSSEPFTTACNVHALVISEMQAVRNRIAHANATSRAAFATVVQRRYGAKLNNVSPGMLLLSPRFSPVLLDQYLTACRVIAKACARA